MNKKIATLSLLSIIVFLLGIVIWGSSNKQNSQENVNLSSPETPVFFYSRTCPHCHEVEEWMKTNKLEEKIKIIKKEVYNNRAHALELEKIAQKCGILKNDLGIPFLYAEEKCFIGTSEITNYFSQKVKQLELEPTKSRV